MQSSSPEFDRRKFLTESINFNYKMLVSACKFTTLYMLKKYSETEFMFEDILSKQYRVKLGKEIVCSCHEGNLGHCIHSLYVLVRVYKLPENHPFIFQSSYSEEDLKQLTSLGTSIKQGRGRNDKTNKSIESVQRLRQSIIVDSPSKITTKQRQTPQSPTKQTLAKKQMKGQWPVFESDTVCAICYDQIQNQTPIIDCSSCRNYFHTKCLKVWVTQKQIQSVECSCPMCRNILEQNIQQRIVKMDKYYVQYHQSHGINCHACGKDILVKIYKCLLCEQYYLCSQCYFKWEHKHHDRFIGKETKKAEWSVTERSQYNINRLNANLEYSKKFGDKSEEFKELMGPKYEQFISGYIKKPTMKEHIINSLMDVEKEIHKTYKKIDFTQNDIVCFLCRKRKIVGMRRMSCKHFIDEKCLKFSLVNNIWQCPIDKKYILPGLEGVEMKIE